MEIKEIKDVISKKEITSNLLRTLPDWFALEDAILNYIEGVANTIYFACYESNECIGFISLKMHFNNSYEVYVMAVAKNLHNKGIGTALLRTSERKLIELGANFLQVKTLSHSRPDQFYDLTRSFYIKNGFTALEEFKTLWDESNPCLQLVKYIK